MSDPIPDFTVQQVQPILSVREVSAALHHYTLILGFKDPWTWGTPPTHGGASLGRASLQFTLNSSHHPDAAGTHFFFVRNINALHALHSARGANIVSPLETKPWFMREYTVRDIDGHLLRFAENLPAHTARKRPARDDIAIADAAPTVAEYTRLINAVGWARYTDLSRAAEILAAARFIAVARDAEKVIATGIVLGDGASFFYLKDIMVDPAYQHQGIGQRLVAHLMARIKSSGASSALVGLFTGKDHAPFYEPFGFAGPDRGLYGMTLRL
jgi:GNAT superfamily N-acetyltransferase/uncharacterized glyoxalase superfamily protein PhnB